MKYRVRTFQKSSYPCSRPMHGAETRRVVHSSLSPAMSNITSTRSMLHWNISYAPYNDLKTRCKRSCSSPTVLRPNLSSVFSSKISRIFPGCTTCRCRGIFLPLLMGRAWLTVWEERSNGWSTRRY